MKKSSCDLSNEIHRGPKVRKHHMPNWLTTKLRQDAKCRGEYKRHEWNAAAYLQHLVGGRWLDHWGTYKKEDGEVVFCSEPYGLYDVLCLGELEYILDVDISVHAESYHYPTRTVRVDLRDRNR